jgi:hypothetical protein
MSRSKLTVAWAGGGSLLSSISARKQREGSRRGQCFDRLAELPEPSLRNADFPVGGSRRLENRRYSGRGSWAQCAILRLVTNIFVALARSTNESGPFNMHSTVDVRTMNRVMTAGGPTAPFAGELYDPLCQ